MHRIAVAAVLALLLAPATAHAGTYHVYTCSGAGKVWAEHRLAPWRRAA